jgi:hypothetical protein
MAVILSEAKDLSIAERKQNAGILRYAQNDSVVSIRVSSTTVEEKP